APGTRAPPVNNNAATSAPPTRYAAGTAPGTRGLPVYNMPTAPVPPTRTVADTAPGTRGLPVYNMPTAPVPPTRAVAGTAPGTRAPPVNNVAAAFAPLNPFASSLLAVGPLTPRDEVPSSSGSGKSSVHLPAERSGLLPEMRAQTWTTDPGLSSRIPSSSSSAPASSVDHETVGGMAPTASEASIPDLLSPQFQVPTEQDAFCRGHPTSDNFAASGADEGLPALNRRTRGRAVDWQPVATFEDECLARDWLESDNEYCKLRTNFTKRGVKRYFYCRGCKRPGRTSAGRDGQNQYATQFRGVQKYLHYDAYSSKVWAFDNGEEHRHFDSTWGIPKRLKILIDQQLAKGVISKPQIVKALEDLTGDPMTLPTSRQVESYIREYKKQQAAGSIRPTTQDLKDLAARYGKLPPEHDIDTAFVIASDFSDGMQIVFSTRRLVKLTRRATMYALDGTYKLMWQGFPLLVLAAVDEHNHTFPVALCISGNERAEDYIKLLGSLNEIAPALGLNQWTPHVVLGDGAPSITAAMKEVFPGALRATCWFHAKQRIEFKLKDLKTPQELLHAMITDICYLQICFTSAMFELGCLLYQKKYTQHNPDAITYLKDQWFTGDNSGWWEGASLRHPSTNNGVESANGKIKGLVLREKLDVIAFGQVVATKLVPTFSRDADPHYPQNYRKFEQHMDIRVGKEDFAKASDWEQKDPPLRELACHNGVLVFTLSGGVEREYLNDESINTFLNLMQGKKTLAVTGADKRPPRNQRKAFDESAIEVVTPTRLDLIS
ncbi:hypothetical protein FOZ62_013312, partial [Perkinsus olseni]